VNFSSLKRLKREAAPLGPPQSASHICRKIRKLPDLDSSQMTNPQEALYLPLMRALSMFPCGTQVLDNLLPHQIIVFAAYPLKAEQVCGMVGC
jgi:hypothetical protein